MKKLPTKEQQINEQKAKLKKATEHNRKIKVAEMTIEGHNRVINSNNKAIKILIDENEMLKADILEQGKISTRLPENVSLIEENIAELSKSV